MLDLFSNAKVSSYVDLILTEVPLDAVKIIAHICHCESCTPVRKQCCRGGVRLGCVQQQITLAAQADARKAAAKTIKPPLCVPKGHLFINSFNNNINNMFIMGCYVHVSIQLAMVLKTKNL